MPRVATEVTMCFGPPTVRSSMSEVSQLLVGCVACGDGGSTPSLWHSYRGKPHGTIDDVGGGPGVHETLPTSRTRRVFMTLGSAAKKASEEPEQRRGTPGERTTRSRVIGFFAGPLLGLLLFLVLPEMPLPLEEGATESVMSLNGSIVAAVTAWIAIWWATEPIPIPATSLLPLVLFPLFIDGVGVEDVSPSYGSDVIFLFMGGFMLALPMPRWDLHRRGRDDVAGRTVGGRSGHPVA